MKSLLQKIALLAIAATLLAIVGCAGKSSGVIAPPVGVGSAFINMIWPERDDAARSTTAPTAADSIEVVISSGTLVVAEAVLNRPNPGTNFPNLPTGFYNVAITAYAGNNATGQVLASGFTTIQIFANQSTSIDVVLESVISQILILPQPANVPVNEGITIGASARNVDNQVVLTAPNRWNWSVISGAGNIQLFARGSEADVFGTQVGSSQVRATYDEAPGVIGEGTVTVTSVQTGQIEGTIFGAGGGSRNPIAGASVFAGAGLGTSNDTGNYSITGLPASTYVVVAAAPGFTPAFQTVVLEPNQTLTVDFLLQPTMFIPIAAPDVTFDVMDGWQTSGIASVTGTITNLDEDARFGVLIINGKEQVFPVQPDGTFQTAAILSNGVNMLFVRGVNQVGATTAGPVELNFTANFRFRVTLTWDRFADLDLHGWDPSLIQASYVNPDIGTLILDVDNTSGFGPENITNPFPIGDTIDGRYRFAANSYSGGAGANAVVTVSVASGPNAGQSFEFGPYIFTSSNFNTGYPVIGSTDAWWRVCDVLVNGNSVNVVAPDATPLPFGGPDVRNNAGTTKSYTGIKSLVSR
ncbi:MAG: carboxypeptidase regulatory-like domain-containing protein [Fimbriimonadaceae bacterium]